MIFFRAVCFTAVVFFVLLILFKGARAHDDYDWIRQGEYRGPTNNEWCCGKEDCFEVPATRIEKTPQGILLKGNKEVVPYKEIMPSEDGKYWRCQRPNGSRRCFFAPIGGV